MKLLITDHLGQHKTTKELEKWFRNKGHEVKWSMYYDPKLMTWCDIALFEWCEGMVNLAIKDGWCKKKPVFCRAMDIEIWARQYNGIDLGQLKGLAYTSRALFSVMNEDLHFREKWPDLNIIHIPLSIDLKEWTFKERKPGRRVAIIGHMWGSKGAVMIPQFVDQLIKKTKDDSWQFYLQGHWRHDVWRWYFHYFKHIIRELKLEKNIFINEKRVPSIDEFLEDKNYLITFSMKDAFSLIVAEAMAKGIKALPHNFIGAKDIWKKYVWSSFDELFYRLLEEEYNSKEYRSFVERNYSNKVIMPKWEKFLGVK